MPSARPIALVLGACLLCVLIAGCGGASSTAAGKPSRAPAYVAAADAVCVQAQAELHKLSEPTTPGQAVAYLPSAIAIINRETLRLAALDPLASRRGWFGAALSDARKLAGVLAAFLHQLRAGIVELATFSQVQTQSTTLRTEINGSFRQAGLSRCVA
ncbi:MAG: hypothetical protein M3Z95_05530 [Actinomycetota bacterium]|nr:hypothetical protein [Actinomycetota bacterium]